MSGTRHGTICAACAAAVFLGVGCDSGSKPAVEGGLGGSGDAAASPVESVDPPRRSVGTLHGIMSQKLVHQQALLEAITLANFARIEREARALTDLSGRSDWQVHTTLAYGVFSGQFRGVTADLAAQARRKNLQGVSADYVRLVQSCLDCHDYLRREGLIKDTPGRITRAPQGIRPVG